MSLEYDRWFKHEVFIPVVLLKNELYELEVYNNEPSLSKVEYSQMIYKYHINGEQKSSLVHFVTEKGLNKYLSKIKELEDYAEIKLLDIRKSK